MEAARPGACPGRDRAPPRRVLERWSALGGPSCGMPHTTQLYQHVPETRWPIVYSSRYNITFMGLEKLHPFDAGKWGKVISFLKVVLCCRYHHRNPPCHLSPQLPCAEEGAEAPSDPDRRNHNGGGFHHCSSDRGGGFCAYADITLAIKGNGHERDFMGDQRVYIMDVYNRHIYPGDRFAKQAIRRKVELEWGTEDDEYLDKVERNLKRALQEHPPDVMVYNAGTDILEGDRLGGLSISPQGIVKRDELVFRVARRCQVPILMVTSGGYQKRTARIIADSILNLYDLGLIGPESASISAQNSDTPLLL
ncbi:histone deacetylase 11 isoform X11 [Myotis myotis]|uniref:histone deacetylase 11 isoform X11 n=1 Tax=Myotis myotis TaxID=51298 RepID=UPI00174935EA|nr:histone deacetylase 11 isoform X11 [Myotis myotis]XP_059544289.1 histone deacetylase 11 isoform X7 [Myotis daubentonii]